MANHDNNNEIKEGFVDISSNKQVNKIYKKRGRAIRITSIVLSILLLIGGSGLLYYYSVLNSLKFVDISDNNSTKATSSTLPTSDGTFSKSQLSNDELLEDSKVLNVMLFGEDNAKGEKFGRSDSMIMLSIDNEEDVRFEIDLITQQSTADEEEYSEEDRQRLARALKELTPRQREAVYLYYIQEVPLSEIPDLLGMNYQSVRNLLHRAMLKLRQSVSTSELGISLVLLRYLSE